MSGLTAFAYVNHGRWVADCPFCGGAEQVWREGLRTAPDVAHPFGIVNSQLYCGTTGAECPVVFPADAPGIVSTLSPRPERNRNWRPPETIEDLEMENVTHGLVKS